MANGFLMQIRKWISRHVVGIVMEKLNWIAPGRDILLKSRAAD